MRQSVAISTFGPFESKHYIVCLNCNSLQKHCLLISVSYLIRRENFFYTDSVPILESSALVELSPPAIALSRDARQFVDKTDVGAGGPPKATAQTSWTADFLLLLRCSPLVADRDGDGWELGIP